MAKSLHNWSIYYLHDRSLTESVAKYFHGRVIDIGCGTKPYSKLLSRYVSEHVGVDRAQPFNKNAVVDLIGTAYAIPAKNGTFDCALSTAALEHLEEPEQALRECNRVLKLDGIAVYTVPLFWHVHAAPWDYYRFTKYGLRHIFEKSGFEIVELKALSGFWVTCGQMFSYYIMRFNRKPISYLRAIPLLTVPIQAITLMLDKIDKAEDWTWMYLVVAKKIKVFDETDYKK